MVGSGMGGAAGTLLLLALLGAGPAGAAGDTTPSAGTAKAFAEAFYASIAEGIQPAGDNIGDPATGETWYSARLAALFQQEFARAEAAGGLCNLDYNPFINGNDVLVTRAEARVVSATPEAAEVEVTVVNFDVPTVIPLLLVWERGGWRVDDVKLGWMGGDPAARVSDDLARDGCLLAE